MKQLFILLFSLLVSVGIYSQACLLDGITFNTQQQIDDFQINYPGCTEIDGFVSIHGDNISDLSGLDCLVKIWGYLGIDNNSLQNLNGLQNLTNLGNGLYIVGNQFLTDLNGLNNITSINGDFFIGSNSRLQDLSSLNNLSRIDGSLTINAI